MISNTFCLNPLRIPSNNCVPCAVEFSSFVNAGRNGNPALQSAALKKEAPSKFGLIPLSLYEDNFSDFLSAVKDYPDRMLVAGKSRPGGNSLFGGNHMFNIIYYKAEDRFEIHDTTVGKKISDSSPFKSFRDYIGEGYLLSLYERPQTPIDESWVND